MFIGSFFYLELDLQKLLNISNTIAFVNERWLPPDTTILPARGLDILTTLAIAFLGTIIPAFFSFFCSFGGSHTTCFNRKLYAITRGVFGFFRAIPEIVLALIFIPTVGLGPLAGVLALSIHNFGVLGKLYSERLENINPGLKEALLMLGASKAAGTFFGIVPKALPNLIADTLYIFERNIRNSLILGFIGAGGIGQTLFIDFKVFDYEKVSKCKRFNFNAFFSPGGACQKIL